jgi:Fibronectin type III domain
VPDPPAACSATLSAFGNKNLVIWWEAPPSNGGSPITSYLIQLWKDGSVYGELTAGPGSIYTTVQLYHTGLFYVRVLAHNDAGWSAPCYTFEYV